MTITYCEIFRNEKFRNVYLVALMRVFLNAVPIAIGNTD